MLKQQLKHPFFISIFGGLFVWLLLFIITPAEVTYPLSIKTLSFVSLSYFFLILGYLIVPQLKLRKSRTITIKIIKYSIVFVLFCFVIRFIDVFYFREFRFSNSIYQNRNLIGNSSQNLLFILASIFKSLFFVPLLLLLLSKIKSKMLFLIASLLFILPLIEAVLKGTRSSFLISSLFFILILIITKSISISKRNIVLISIGILVLFGISTQILLNREGPKNKNPYGYLVEKAIYNDFFKPKQAVIDYMNNPKIANRNKKISLSALQIGQYYTHGLFEFDYVIKYYQKKTLQKQYGKYTFQVFPKFTNRFNLTNYNQEEIYLTSPRGYTFISFFGGMYLDFGWFALIAFFILGVFQKICYQRIKNNSFPFAPVFVFLLFTNFFMLTFNFFRGGGTYTLISCLIFAVLFSFPFKKINSKKYEKGIST